MQQKTTSYLAENFDVLAGTYSRPGHNWEIAAAKLAELDVVDARGLAPSATGVRQACQRVTDGRRSRPASPMVQDTLTAAGAISEDQIAELTRQVVEQVTRASKIEPEQFRALQHGNLALVARLAGMTSVVEASHERADKQYEHVFKSLELVIQHLRQIQHGLVDLRSKVAEIYTSSTGRGAEIASNSSGRSLNAERSNAALPERLMEKQKQPDVSFVPFNPTPRSGR